MDGFHIYIKSHAGLSILIAAGAAYGAKKVNDLRKKD
jgi:hypothetical protein